MAAEKKRYLQQARTAQKRQRLQEAAARRNREYVLPAPLRANVLLGPITDEESGESMVGAFIEGNAQDGNIRIGQKDAYALAHETAHLLDAQVLTDGDRRFFQRLMKAPEGEWWQGVEGSRTGTPAEWFADYYAHVATGTNPAKGKGVASYVSGLNAKRYRQFGKAMERLGKRYGLKPYKERY